MSLEDILHRIFLSTFRLFLSSCVFSLLRFPFWQENKHGGVSLSSKSWSRGQFARNRFPTWLPSPQLWTQTFLLFDLAIHFALDLWPFSLFTQNHVFLSLKWTRIHLFEKGQKGQRTQTLEVLMLREFDRSVLRSVQQLLMRQLGIAGRGLWVRRVIGEGGDTRPTTLLHLFNFSPVCVFPNDSSKCLH